MNDAADAAAVASVRQLAESLRCHTEGDTTLAAITPEMGRLNGTSPAGVRAGVRAARSGYPADTPGRDGNVLQYLARTYVCWTDPAMMVTDILDRLVVAVMEMGTREDAHALLRIVGDRAFHAVLDAPPHGITSDRSLAFWHYPLRREGDPARARHCFCDVLTAVPGFPDRPPQEPAAAATAARRWITVGDRDGLRHSITIASIAALSDADPNREATATTLPGGRVVLVGEPLEAVRAATGGAR